MICLLIYNNENNDYFVTNRISYTIEFYVFIWVIYQLIAVFTRLCRKSVILQSDLSSFRIGGRNFAHHFVCFIAVLSENQDNILPKYTKPFGTLYSVLILVIWQRIVDHISLVWYVFLLLPICIFFFYIGI